MKLKQEYLDNRDIDVDSRKVTAADFGLSGKAEHSRVSLPKLVLGDLTFEDVKTNLSVLWIITHQRYTSFRIRSTNLKHDLTY